LQGTFLFFYFSFFFFRGGGSAQSRKPGDDQSLPLTRGEIDLVGFNDLDVQRCFDEVMDLLS
jgi:hypothetical protein